MVESGSLMVSCGVVWCVMCMQAFESVILEF